MHITQAPRAVLSAGASEMRDKLVAYVHQVLNVEPVTHTRRQYEGLLHGPVGFETLYCFVLSEGLDLTLRSETV
jgi:hypothetical protein